jgi:uncharacterized membrane protein YfcA
MVMPSTPAWKLALAATLAAAILTSAFASAPRRAVASSDLKRLVLAAITLYAVGALASLTHHPALAGVVYAAGIVVCALAAWLSRGTDAEDPPRGNEPVDERPPPAPDGVPNFDWADFERAFRAHSERQRRDPAGVR